MTIQQPLSTDPLNSPDHALSHRIFANDSAAPVESVVVDSNGNVGIGTTGPNTILHINKSVVDNTPMFKLTGVGNYPASPTDTANGVGIGLVYNGSGNRQFWIGDSANGNGYRINGYNLSGWNFISQTDADLSIGANGK